jgi:hypothetical protein
LKNLFGGIRKKYASRAQLLFADDFLNMLVVYRSLWIRGRYGGGKTILSVILAAWLMTNGKVSEVHSNFPTVVSSPVVWNKRQDDICNLMDEMHAFAADRKDADGYAGYLRKTNYYLIMPSVMPPHIKLTFFSCQRTLNGYLVGLPFWYYKWDIRSGKDKTDGWFIVWCPHLAFGSYDTKYIPFDDNDIQDHILYNMWAVGEEESKKHGRKNKIRKPERMEPENEDIKQPKSKVADGQDNLLNEVADVNQNMADVSEQIDDAIKGIRKLRRR